MQSTDADQYDVRQNAADDVATQVNIATLSANNTE